MKKATVRNGILAGGMATFFFLGVAAPTAAQVERTVMALRGEIHLQPAEGSLLARPAGLEVRGVMVSEALALLSTSANVSVAFSPNFLPESLRVYCDCRDASIAEALDQILSATEFGYLELGDQIVIAKRVPRRIIESVRPPRSMVALASLNGSPAPVALGGSVSAARSVSPQLASISGTVRDGGTGGPLSGATVWIEGTERGTITNPSGRYVLMNVPAGTHIVVASMIGYASRTQSVTVGPGEALALDFALSIAPVRLDELVVTATGERRRAEVANVVGTVDVEAAVRAAPISNMSQLLTARSPSVQVLSVAGTAGAQSRIRIRGQSSMSLSNDPIVYVDGIRVASGAGGAMETASRFDDLNPSEISSIDILKGPAAVALYGTDASNGVIVITTKRGAVGPPQWNVFVETGITEQAAGFPSAYYSAGRRTDTGAPTQCLLVGIAAGTCVQDELRSLNLFEDPRSTPFSTGRLTQTGAQVSGGSEEVRYFLSADFTDELGTLRMPKDEQERILQERGAPIGRAQRIPNSLRAINLRSNISAAVTPIATVDVSVGYTDRDHQLTNSGGSLIFALMRNGLQGRGYRDELNGWWTYPAGDIFGVEEVNLVGRLIGSIGTSLHPATWLTARARVGLDRVNQENSVLQRRNEGLVFSNYRNGRKVETRIAEANYTWELGATASFSVSPAIDLRTSIGGQYFRRITQTITASGTVLSPGTEHVGGTATRTSNEANSGSANLGAFVEQMVSLNDRLFFTGSVRTDQNSAFGRDFDAVVYPRASLSWVASREPFFPEIDALNTLRLRLAYGTSGVSPGTLHALRYYTAVQTFEGGAERPGLQFHAIGNVDLEPERTTELETGFDVELFEGRTSLEVTHYRKRSRDALVNRPLGPSLGLNSLSRFENLGSVQNHGWEASLHLRPIERASWGWDVSLSGSTNDNELLKLGEGVTPVRTFTGTQAVEGYRLWGRWARPILGWEDTNGNGIIEPSEVQVGDEEVYLGPSVPTREAAVSSNIVMLNGLLRIVALLDYRGGHLAYDRSEADRCTGATNCRAVNDPTAPLREQARAVAANTAALGRTHAGYFEDGAYTTLRELSLSVQVPNRFVQRVGANGATVTVAGRNLHTWTGYGGISPEGSWIDNQGIDMNLVPLSRYWTIRVNANF
jgi:TonB-linked SusC/RagA family outer membrane protein